MPFCDCVIAYVALTYDWTNHAKYLQVLHGSGTRVSHPMHKCRRTENTQILGLRGLEIWHYIPTLIGRREHGQEINGMFSNLHFNTLKNKTNKQTYLHKETSRWTSRQEITLRSFNLLIRCVTLHIGVFMLVCIRNLIRSFSLIISCHLSSRHMKHLHDLTAGL